MIVNGKALLRAKPIVGMVSEKRRDHGVSWGLAEAGYDIRVRQEVVFETFPNGMARVSIDGGWPQPGRFTLASSVESFRMPRYLVGLVKDKSTWARRGLSVFNTVIEPSWGMGEEAPPEGNYLTLELVFHGEGKLVIPAGAGIAQVLFEELEENAVYTGKYARQEDRPEPARESV